MTSQAEIGNLRVRLGIDSAEFANGVRNVQGSLATLGNSIKTFATAAAAVTVFREAIASLHDVADMGDVAEAIGLTAEQLQVYNKMALASGTTSDIMARGLQTIAEQSTDAKSKLSELFDANGLQTAGKSMNQIIMDFMTLLQNAKTPAEQLAIATGVLGDKVGRQLVESLRSGASGWNEAFNSMVKDGYYLSNEQVKAAQAIETKYNQVLANLTSAWQKFVVLVAQGIDAAVNPDMGGSKNKFRFNYGLGVAPGVPAAGGSSSGADGKGDLPGNINTGNGYSVNKPTANPFNGISAPKASIVPKIKPGTIDDIYGAGKAVKQLQEDIAATVPQATLLEQSFQDMADTIASSLGNAITGLISGTMSLKEAFRSVAQSISQQLAQLAQELIKSAILKFLSMMVTPAGGGGGAGSNIGGVIFGGPRAMGGPVSFGKSYLVGENGPEMFTPRSSGSITSNDKLGGSAPQMNVTVINNSSAQVQAKRGANGDLKIMVNEIMAESVIRGGTKIDAALTRSYGLKRAGR